MVTNTFLFIGGFIMANAIQKWDLHQRIALNIILRLGSSINKIILGFMIATGFLYVDFKYSYYRHDAPHICHIRYISNKRSP